MLVVVRLALVLGREVHVREVSVTLRGVPVLVVMVEAEVLEGTRVLVEIVGDVIVPVGVNHGLVLMLVTMIPLVAVLVLGAA